MEQPAYYLFTREDLRMIVDHPLFIEAVRLAVEQTFIPDNKTFRGSQQELTDFGQLSPKDYYTYISDKPLAYISYCRDADDYQHDDTEYQLTKREELIRMYILLTTRDKYDPSWWFYIHNCHVEAPLITYTMVKLLYPDVSLYLYNGRYHYTLLNKPLEFYSNYKGVKNTSRDLSKALVFDLSYFVLDNSMDWIFDNGGIYKDFTIEDGYIVEYYISTYLTGNNTEIEDKIATYKWYAKVLKYILNRP